MGFLDWLKSVGKREYDRRKEYFDKAQYMSDAELVRALNCSSGTERSVYASVAKGRGNIGYKDGVFFEK